MKFFSAAEMAAIEAGTAITAAAVDIACDPPARFWTGYGTLPIGGADYVGLGSMALVKGTSAALGSADQNITLSASGIDPEALVLLSREDVRGAAVTIHRLLFSGDGRTMLGAHVFKRGRVDQVQTEEAVGGAAEIRVLVETAARGLGRSGQRMRTDADQRLVKPTDGFFRKVAYISEIQLAWGGKKPETAEKALGGIAGIVGGIVKSRAGRS